MASGTAQPLSLQGLKPPFQRHGLKFSQIEKLLLDEVEVICFNLFQKKPQVLRQKYLIICNSWWNISSSDFFFNSKLTIWRPLIFTKSCFPTLQEAYVLKIFQGRAPDPYFARFARNLAPPLLNRCAAPRWHTIMILWQAKRQKPLCSDTRMNQLVPFQHRSRRQGAGGCSP